MTRRGSLGWPITLGVVLIVLIVATVIVSVLLNVFLSQGSPWWWAIFTVCIVFLALILVGVVLYLIISIKEIRLNQRQANFVDAVTHELKSPIASMKLCVQTLSRRNVTEQQQMDFYKFMLDDLERLDSLINHVLEAAQADKETTPRELENVPLAPLLTETAKLACHRFHLPEQVVSLDIEPVAVRARPMDLEIIFRNLIDNALKYSGGDPQILVEARAEGAKVIARVIDNGLGVPANQHRNIFRRFVRLGSELERTQRGAGLGLFITRNLVKRLRGKVSVQGRGAERGAIFEVELPAAPYPAPAPSAVSRTPSEPDFHAA